VSTAGATSAADGAREERRRPQRYGRIVVVGGGCYGSYYVRQLGRAERAGAISWEELVVVDREPTCAVGALPAEERPPAMRLVVSGWHEYFAEYLPLATADAARHADAIVPSPLMPHLMADWLVARARARWPQRSVHIDPIEPLSSIPWQRSAEDGTHYVSFAEWICPINCIEPARCPEIRDVRTWSLPVALQALARSAGAAGHDAPTPLLFHCTHRVYGVGMIDVRDVANADATIAARDAAGEESFLLGTVSHCHGALRKITIGSP
jgi:hypothetical protein